MSELTHKFPPEELLELRSAQRLKDEKIQMMPSVDVLNNPRKLTRGLFRAYRTKAEALEPVIDERQQLLFDVIAVRPKEPDQIMDYDTYFMAEKLIGLPNATYPSNIMTAVWARNAAHLLAGVPLTQANYVYEEFDIACSTAESWVPIATNWAKTTTETDPGQCETVQEIAKLITGDEGEQRFIQAIIAIALTQLAYYKEVRQLTSGKRKPLTVCELTNRRLPKAYADKFTPLPTGLDATIYVRKDLVPWEANELLHDPQKPLVTGENYLILQPDSTCTDQEPNERGKIYLTALRIAKAAREECEQQGRNVFDSSYLALLLNADMLADHVGDIHYIRRFMFDAAGVSFDDHAHEAASMYYEDVSISPTGTDAWLRSLDEKLNDDDKISQMLDESFEFIYPDMDISLRPFYRTAAAVALDHARHFERFYAVMPDMSDESLGKVQAQLADVDDSTTWPEPALTGPEVRRIARIPTAWPANELLHDPRLPYDPETNKIINPTDEDLIDRGLSDEQWATFKIQVRIQRILRLREKADKDIEAWEGLRSWFSKDMARRVLHTEPSKEQAGLAHRARSVVFSLEGISHDAGIVGSIHNVYNNNHSIADTNKEEWRELATKARQSLSDDPTNREKLEKLERALTLLADTPEELEAVRDYAYLTLQQINEYRRIKATANADN